MKFMVWGTSPVTTLALYALSNRPEFIESNLALDLFLSLYAVTMSCP